MAPGKSYVIKGASDITISGFVQASYFYNMAHPKDGMSDAYLWNTKDNSFSLNKFKLTIASKPVATDKWDAGFRASLMFGDDAPQLNTPGLNGERVGVRGEIRTRLPHRRNGTTCCGTSRLRHLT